MFYFWILIWQCSFHFFFRLTLTKQLGDLISAFYYKRGNRSSKCLALAQQVYTEIEHHSLAVICMIKQGRLKQALEYAQQRGRMKEEHYAQVLREAPSLQLTQFLFRKNARGNSILPLGAILGTLLTTNKFEFGITLLGSLQIKASQGLFLPRHSPDVGVLFGRCRRC